MIGKFGGRPFVRIFIAAVFIIILVQSGCDSGPSFTGTYRYEHTEQDAVSGEAVLKLDEVAELIQNGQSITGIYTRVVTPVRFSNCSGSVKSSIVCTLSGDNIARCTFPQYAEKEFLCDQSAIYSTAVGCGRASVDCVPFSVKQEKRGKTILIEVPEFDMQGIFWEARTWEMKRQ